MLGERNEGGDVADPNDQSLDLVFQLRRIASEFDQDALDPAKLRDGRQTGHLRAADGAQHRPRNYDHATVSGDWRHDKIDAEKAWPRPCIASPPRALRQSRRSTRRSRGSSRS